jgi:antitoxin (DNA-binding transcriptional repressor) of toxin-antitoxin stability system
MRNAECVSWEVALHGLCGSKAGNPADIGRALSAALDRAARLWDKSLQTVMKTIDVLTQTASLAELVELAKQEAGLVLVKSGQPVAQVLPVSQSASQRVAPLHPGAMEVSEDFDAPLPDEFWLGKA